MHTISRNVLLLAAYITACGGSAISPPSTYVSDKVQAHAHKQDNTPVAVKGHIGGAFSKGYGWNLEVKPNGAAFLSIGNYLRSKQLRFKVTAGQLAALGRTVQRERFFELGEEYGDAVPDGSTRTLTIVSGSRRKTVTLRFLRVEDAKLPQIKRAVRVWNIVREWFHDEDAVDLCLYDQRLLNAP